MMTRMQPEALHEAERYILTTNDEHHRQLQSS